MSRRKSSILVVALLGALVGCKQEAEQEQGAAPPPIPSARPGVCASGGGAVGDEQSVAYFPRTEAGYCIDPNAETRSYGAEAKGSLDEVCTQQFDGECEVYKSFGLKRVVTLRYVDGAGSPGAVSVTLSRFDSKEGAYGFFTKRVVADGDPLQVAPQALTAGAAGALGSGIAYVWRAQHVAELSYTNELESPDQLRASSSKALPPLAKAIGDKLPGDTTPPAAVPLLPQPNQIKMGISFKLNDILGVSGTGSGAVGYYKEGDKRWRVFAILKADEDSAQDVIQTFKKLDGAKALKDTPFPVLRVPRQRDETSPPVEWLVVRKNNQVFGVGDEELVDAENKKAALTEAEKLERLKPLVEGG